MKVKDKKVVVIAGGAGKLGLLAAGRYLENGHLVVLIDRNLLALKAATEKFRNPNLDSILADVTRTDDTRRYVNEIKRKFGEIDTYIHCVGIKAQARPIVGMPKEDFIFNKHFNFTGIWLALQYVKPKIKMNGQMLIISSKMEYYAPMRMNTIDPLRFEDILTRASDALPILEDGIEI